MDTKNNVQKIYASKKFIEDEDNFEDFKIASEEIELIEDNSDLTCSEKIQDVLFKRFEPSCKEKNVIMPGILEETDEDMSNNCSPNKNEVINAIVKKQKNESFNFLKYYDDIYL